MSEKLPKRLKFYLHYLYGHLSSSETQAHREAAKEVRELIKEIKMM